MSDAPPKPPITTITWLLIVMNVAVFAIELASGANALAPTAQDMIRLGGNFAPLTLHGEWWRIVTSMFLHYGVLHIGMNMLCLYQGRVVETVFGHAGFAAIYMVAGVLGGVGSIAHASNVVSAGASGAVFGVFGAFGAFLLLRRKVIDPTAWSATARRLATFVVLNLAIGLSASGIDITAHIVGLISGFAVGAALLAGKGSHRLARSAIAVVAGCGLAAGVAATLPKP